MYKAYRVQLPSYGHQVIEMWGAIGYAMDKASSSGIE